MILQSILHRITASRPMRLIEVSRRPYLERYYLGKILGREVWLHHFLTADGDRHVHSHPWWATSIILTGGYVEETATLEGQGMIRSIESLTAPAINRIPAGKLHRIARVTPGTWTLMIVGPRHGQGWHFYADDGTTTRGPSAPKDWHLTALNRDRVYALRKWSVETLAMIKPAMTEADGCAHRDSEFAVPDCPECGCVQDGQCLCTPSKPAASARHIDNHLDSCAAQMGATCTCGLEKQA